MEYFMKKYPKHIFIANVIIGIDISTVLEQVRYTEKGVAEVRSHCETRNTLFTSKTKYRQNT